MNVGKWLANTETDPNGKKKTVRDVNEFEATDINTAYGRHDSVSGKRNKKQRSGRERG